MNKRILLLYFKDEQKSRFAICEEILKTLFRKFRASVHFTFLHLDLSPVCRDMMTKRLLKEVRRNDAIFLCHDDDLSCCEESFLEESMGFYAGYHQNTGINLFFPYEKRVCREENGIITEKFCYNIDKAESLIRICTDYAKENSKTLFVCTDEGGIDGQLFKDFEKHSSKYKHLDTKHMTPKEIIRQSAFCILKPCVILTRRHIADTLLLHTCTPMKMQSGHTKLCTESAKIYKPLSIPFSFEEIQKLRLFLIAFSALTEEILNMKNAAHWLRRSIDTAFSQFGITSKEELTFRIVSSINEPMRKRSKDYE